MGVEAAGSGQAGRDLTVLLVDDEPDMLEVTAAMLADQSDRFETVQAPSATDGLAVLETTDVDCVVSDYEMPGQDGLAFLEDVRERYPDLPFILFTGRGSEEIAAEAISRGVTDYLRKQVGTDQYALLANRVTNAVGQYRAQRQATAQRRINTVVNEVNHRLVRADSHGDIYAALSEVLVEVGPFAAAWTGPLDPETDGFDAVATEGTVGERSAVDVALASPWADDSPLAAARRTGELHTDAAAGRWLAAGSQHAAGIDVDGTLVVVPLGLSSSLAGLWCGYLPPEEHVGEPEHRMLTELGDDAGHALEALDLRAELRQYERIVETVPDGVFLLDDEGTIDFVNETGAEMLGLSPGDVTGTPFPSLVERGLFDYEVIETYVEVVRELLSDDVARERATLEVDVEAESGERTWEVHVALRDSRSDRFAGTVGVIHDATERIEGKQELRKATARYQHLVETSPAPIVIYDSTGTLVFANDAAAALVGATDPDDLVGTPAAEFIHPDQREAAKGIIDRVLTARERVSGVERTVVGLDGTEREVVLGSSPITYENEPAGQVVLVDVTDLGGD